MMLRNLKGGQACQTKEFKTLNIFVVLLKTGKDHFLQASLSTAASYLCVFIYFLDGLLCISTLIGFLVPLVFSIFVFSISQSDFLKKT